MGAILSHGNALDLHEGQDCKMNFSKQLRGKYGWRLSYIFMKKQVNEKYMRLFS